MRIPRTAIRGAGRTGGGTGAGGFSTLGTVGPPTEGTHVAREVRVDDDGNLWFCTVGGTPGTWVSYTDTTTATLPTLETGVAPDNEAEIFLDGDEINVRMRNLTRIIGVRVNGPVQSNDTTPNLSLLSSTVTPPAGLLAQADVLRMRARGTMANDSGSNTTFQFKLLLAGSTLFDTGAQTVADMATGVARSWSLDGMWRLTNTNGGRHLNGQCDVRLGPVPGGTTMLLDYIVPQSANIDDPFATPGAFDFVVTMGNAVSSISAQCLHFTLERLRDVV